MYMQQKLSITDISVMLIVSIIYFTMYFHPWFGQLLGQLLGIKIGSKGDIVFLFLLFYIFIIYSLLFLQRNKVVKRKINSSKRLFIPLLLYFIFGAFVVILHEESFDAITRYLFYLFTPMMVFLSVFGIYRSNEKIIMTLHVFFILGIIFSIYSTVLHIMLGSGNPNISSMYGDPTYEKEYAARFTIPGIPPNALQSMLTPLILTGFYFSRNSYGKLKHLYMGATLFVFYSIIITASRGAFISLMAGMIYLLWKGWFRFNKKTIFVILSLALILFVGGKLFQSRMASTYSVLERVLEEGTPESEVRLVAMVDSFTSYIIHNPIFGSGFTYFFTSQDERLHGLGDHNLYTMLLAQGGLVVFIPFVFILAFLYFNSRKILRKNVFADPSSRDIGILLIAGLLAFIVDNNFPPGFFHYYWVWFGLVAAWTRNCEVEYHRKRLANEYTAN